MLLDAASPGMLEGNGVNIVLPVVLILIAAVVAVLAVLFHKKKKK